VLVSPAQARWGNEHCSLYTHCYGLAVRNAEKYGGFLASIDYVDTTPVDYNGIWAPDATNEFVDEEQWISWPKISQEEWIETGQSNGQYNCCTEHPFYAQQKKGIYKEYLSPGEMPLNTYNHYVLFDAEGNGTWHIYWGCCEVWHYDYWPKYLMEQEAGIEAATAEQPYNWGRQMVAASDGGEWWPWTGTWILKEPGICTATNVESSAEGNIMWSTQPGC
jgi:hypothetical protein